MQTDVNWIEDIRNAVEDEKIKLSDWEEGFVESIEEKLLYGGNLTRKQREKLDDIHSRIRAW